MSSHSYRFRFHFLSLQVQIRKRPFRFHKIVKYIHFDIYGHSPAEAPARPKGGVGQGARAVFAALPLILNL